MPEDRDAEHHRALDEAITDSLAIRPRDLVAVRDPKLVGYTDSVRTGLARTLGTHAYAYPEGGEKKYMLSPDKFIGNLKSRFDLCKKKSFKDISWADVEKSLCANPEDLFSIYKLEETGGEPQLVYVEGDEFVFEDRSKESPIGRRSMTFEDADAQRMSFGTRVRFQNPNSYLAMQKEELFDSYTMSWLETDDETRARKEAIVGGRNSNGPYAVISPEACHSSRRGWRASIRIKKV